MSCLPPALLKENQQMSPSDEATTARDAIEPLKELDSSVEPKEVAELVKEVESPVNQTIPKDGSEPLKEPEVPANQGHPKDSSEPSKEHESPVNQTLPNDATEPLELPTSPVDQALTEDAPASEFPTFPIPAIHDHYWQSADGDNATPPKVAANVHHSTINSSAADPEHIKYIMLFHDANPRWESDGIIFVKSSLRILPGGERFKDDPEPKPKRFGNHARKPRWDKKGAGNWRTKRAPRESRSHTGDTVVEEKVEGQAEATDAAVRSVKKLAAEETRVGDENPPSGTGEPGVELDKDAAGPTEASQLSEMHTEKGDVATEVQKDAGGSTEAPSHSDTSTEKGDTTAEIHDDISTSVEAPQNSDSVTETRDATADVQNDPAASADTTQHNDSVTGKVDTRAEVHKDISASIEAPQGSDLGTGKGDTTAEVQTNCVASKEAPRSDAVTADSVPDPNVADAPTVHADEEPQPAQDTTYTPDLSLYDTGPIAVFEQTTKQQSGDFRFSGFFKIARVQFLTPHSPELFRMLEQKFSTVDKFGRVKQRYRSPTSWEASMCQRWAVVKMERDESANTELTPPKIVVRDVVRKASDRPKKSVEEQLAEMRSRD